MVKADGYITEYEFMEYAGEHAPSKFKYYLMQASAELDSVTRFHYHHHELGDDFVSEQFKKALVAQIVFYDNVGTTSSEELNQQPDSVSIGGTTVSYNRNQASAESVRRESALSQDALNLLRGTGLLYRGLDAYGS